MLLAGAAKIVAFNPADKTASTTLSNANKTASCPRNNGVRSLQSVSSGSWYIEIKVDANGNAPVVAVANASHSITVWPGSDANSTGYNGNTTGSLSNNGNVTGGVGGYGAGDVIGVHVLFGTGVRFTKNNAVVGSGYQTLPAGPIMFECWQDDIAGTSQFTINQTPQYALPSGATYWPAS